MGGYGADEAYPATATGGRSKHLGTVRELVVALCGHVRGEVADAVIVQLGEAQLVALRDARPTALERADSDDRQVDAAC